MLPIGQIKHRQRSVSFIVLPLLMITMAVFGFWSQYYGRLVTGEPLEGVSLEPLVHVHSALFLLWLGIIVLQSVLVHRNRTKLHCRLGPWLAGIGYAAAVVGVFAGLKLAAARAARTGDLDGAATFVAAPLLDMMMFAGFLTASIAWRKYPEAHKRLILFTGYSFAFVGLVRYLVRLGLAENLWLATGLLLLPILLCVAWELAMNRRVHPVWWIGLGVFFARLMLELLATFSWWLPVGRRLIRAFG